MCRSRKSGWLLVHLILISLAAAGISHAAQDWTLPTANGGQVSFQEHLAQGPVLVSFWATWCRPCLKELPHLEALAATYQGRLTVMAVNTDGPKAVAKVAPLVMTKGYENVIFPLDTAADLQERLHVDNIPFLILFDRQGNEVYRHIGYKEGDELELQAQVKRLMSTAQPAVSVRTPTAAGTVTASDRFEYSYANDTRREIVENWLDVAYTIGNLRTGIMLNSRAPSEEGIRENKIAHRFFSFDNGNFNIRAGHFYGLFGRGLIFNAYEDRTVRIDTRLDGLIVNGHGEKWQAAVFSGSPLSREVDVRGLDGQYNVTQSLRLGVTGLTFRPDDFVATDGKINREWATGLRAEQHFPSGDYYLETAWKNYYDFQADSGTYDEQNGRAYYGNLNLYRGPISVSWETMDYDHYAVLARADGKTTLNRPPALARELTWTLLNRAPHNLNPNNERGNNLDVMWDSGTWALNATGAHLEDQAGTLVYDLAYGDIKHDSGGALALRGGFAYQENEGRRQTVVGELVWRETTTRSWTFQAEHQHVRLGSGRGFNLGAFDIEWFKLELETPPHWALVAVLETNNKYPEQRGLTEEKGPFPAGQITYTFNDGGNFNVWFGKRQEGFLCSGGVCKFEPAFSGVEMYGTFRY